MNALPRPISIAAAAIALVVAGAPALAGPRGEFREGLREIGRERWEMRRELLQADNRFEARREFREGIREITRERREMRREIRREFRGEDRRRDVGRVVAGVVLGTTIAVAIAGRVPRAPHPDLCWYWTNDRRHDGHWYYCRD
jgi:hypothetical protein